MAAFTTGKKRPNFTLPICKNVPVKGFRWLATIHYHPLYGVQQNRKMLIPTAFKPVKRLYLQNLS
jgi:hypothetical protein